MKDRAPLENVLFYDSRIRVITISARKSSRVEIYEASISDNGVYECIARNDAGNVSTSFQIQLLQGIIKNKSGNKS